MKTVMFSCQTLRPKIRGVLCGFICSSVLNTLRQGHSWGKLALWFNASLLCYSIDELWSWFQQDFNCVTFESGCSWITQSFIPWQEGIPDWFYLAWWWLLYVAITCRYLYKHYNNSCTLTGCIYFVTCLPNLWAHYVHIFPTPTYIYYVQPIRLNCLWRSYISLHTINYWILSASI